MDVSGWDECHTKILLRQFRQRGKARNRTVSFRYYLNFLMASISENSEDKDVGGLAMSLAIKNTLDSIPWQRVYALIRRLVWTSNTCSFVTGPALLLALPA